MVINPLNPNDIEYFESKPQRCLNCSREIPAGRGTVCIQCLENMVRRMI